MLVILLFLRSIHATLIPAAAVPLSLLGATAVIYLAGFSLDNLSLMAFTIAVGFVVDDAIVVLENIFRHLEAGTTPLQSAIKGAREIGFTVISISISLIAVFIPLLLMSGIVGRLFHEFAITVTAAILISVDRIADADPDAVLALPGERARPPARPHLPRHRMGLRRRRSKGTGAGSTSCCGISLRRSWCSWRPSRPPACCSCFMPKGFFPTQDIGMLLGISEAGQDVSPTKMKEIQRQLSDVIAHDPDVADFGSFFGPSYGNTQNTGRFIVGLKPRDDRNATAAQIVDRLRPQLAKSPGRASCSCSRRRTSPSAAASRAASFSTCLQDPDQHELNAWTPRLIERLKKLPQLADVATDAQNEAPMLTVTINRDAAARFGIQPQLIDDTLNDAFGQRQVTQYFTNNSYYLEMEVSTRSCRRTCRRSTSSTSRRRPTGNWSRSPLWSPSTPTISARCWSPIRGNFRP